MTNQTPKICAIIVAAGSSERMNGIDKIFAPLAGKPVLAWTVDAFQDSPSVDSIVIVVSKQNMERTRQLSVERNWSKVADVCAGGEKRQDSVAEGLKCLPDCEWVIVHDGARPLVTVDLIERGLEAARETGSAVAAVPVTDTIKMALENMIVQGTPPRKSLWAVQTPQVFRFDIIKAAYRQAKYDVTDDATLVEKAGYKVKLYMGSYDNIKITTPEDLAIAEILVHKHGK